MTFQLPSLPFMEFKANDTPATNSSTRPIDNADDGGASALLCVRSDRIVTAAMGLEPLLGYQDNQILGYSIDSIIEQPQVLNGAWDIPTGIRHNFEVRCRHRTGQPVPMAVGLSSIHTSAGTQIWAHLRESPLARRAEVTRHLLTALATWSTDAVMSATLDGEITFWNPSAQRVYGYHRHEVIGQPVSMLYVGDPRQELGRWMPQVAQGETVRLEDARRRCKNGTIVQGIVTISPIADTTGTIIGAASLTHPAGTNGTGEATFKALLEAVTIAIIGVGPTGRIVMVNSRAERLFGYSSAELINQPVDILVPDALRNHHAHLRTGYLADPHTRPMGTGVPLFARRKDGTQVPVEVSLAPIIGGDDLLIAASIRDLTSDVERSRLELEIQHSRRLESIGQLAGGVAHGFNNLLGVIDGYTRFIQEQAQQEASTAPDSTYATIAADAGKVVEAGTRAATLARQLLAFARADNAEPQELDLGTAVRDATELLRRSLGQHIVIDLHLTAIRNPSSPTPPKSSRSS